MGIITPGYEVSALAPWVRWADHDHQAHVVQFYTEDGALLNSLDRFIGTALEAGDAPEGLRRSR